MIKVNFGCGGEMAWPNEQAVEKAKKDGKFRCLACATDPRDGHPGANTPMKLET